MAEPRDESTVERDDLSEIDPSRTRPAGISSSAPTQTETNGHSSPENPTRDIGEATVPDDLRTVLDAGPIRPGQTLFDRYLVERQIGEGGMGSVWLVRHLELDVPRALKLIVSGIAFDPQARVRFKREARVMARLAHPHAVGVHDARMSADTAFIEMEYIPGKNLAGYLRSGEPMPLDWVARLLDQLCDVLQSAHDLGIVHRDLKPSNIMLIDGRPPGREVLKVLDFGIAKIFDPDFRDPDDVATRTGHSAFTPQYASPEQIGGGDIDGRSDLYSVGVLLYEMLSGHRPFSGPTALFDHICTLPRPPSEKNPGARIPPRVEQVVMRCLAKDPTARFPTARALADAFREAVGEVISWSPVASNTALASGHTSAVDPLAKTHSDVPTPLDLKTLRSGPDTLATASTTEAVGAYATQKPSPSWKRGSSSTSARRPMLVALAVVLPVCGFLVYALRPGGNTTRTPAVVAVKDRAGGPDGFALPAGYVVVSGSGTDLVNGWPRVVERIADKARYVRLAGGTFLMGGPSPKAEGSGDDPRSDERPPHPVTLSDFYLQTTEVTNGELERYFKARGIDRPGRWAIALSELHRQGENVTDDYPAVGVPHDMAEDYARWVGGRLPTEAQWEYAARSGGLDRPYVGGDTMPGPSDAVLNMADRPTPQAVGRSGDRTEHGVFDLAGNVREWCRDRFAPYVNSADPVRDPEGPTSVDLSGKAVFVVRGGSYKTFADVGRTTGPRRPNDRDGSSTGEQIEKDGAADDLGFRVVLEWPARK